MRSSITLVLLAFYAVAAFYACNKSGNDGGATCKYEDDLKPLVTTKCASAGCHGAGSTVADFTQYAALKKRADNGVLRRNVLELGIMPPGTHEPLTAKEKETLTCWLDNGAPEN